MSVSHLQIAYWLMSVAPGRAQAETKLELWWELFQEAPTDTLCDHLPSELGHNPQLHQRMIYPKGKLGRHQSPAKLNPTP